MPRFILTLTAETDLEKIWTFISADNPVAADKVVREIYRTCEGLAGNPQVGRLRDEFAPQLRSIPIGKYIVFYRPMKDGITVDRVLHGARDLPNLF